MHALILLAALAVSDLPPAKEVKPHLPNPPTPNCQCGCTETGKCTCKDCDHPALEKPQAKAKSDGFKIETIAETGPGTIGSKPATFQLKPVTDQPYTMSYKSGYKLSKRSGMPLVVWVGLEPRQIGEGRLVNVGVKELEGYRAPCIVVAKWVDGRLMGKEVKSIAEAKDWLYPPVRRPPAPRVWIAPSAGGSC